MLSEKSWNREVLLLFMAGLLISWCLGMLMGILLEQFLPMDAFARKSFYHFLVSTLTFHGATLVLAHQFLKLHGTTWSEFLGLNRPHLQRAVIFALVIGLLVLPMVLMLNEWATRLMNSLGTKAVPQPSMKVLESTVGLGQRLCFGVAAIVVAPVAEEALFRGILYSYVKQQGHRLLALFGTSLLFAASHSNLGTFVPLTFFALVLVFVYEKTDKLLAPILTHALFNLVNFLFFLFEAKLPRWVH
jgi:membrane protease YdiL (CAAX protease family)